MCEFLAWRCFENFSQEAARSEYGPWWTYQTTFPFTFIRDGSSPICTGLFAIRSRSLWRSSHIANAVSPMGTSWSGFQDSVRNLNEPQRNGINMMAVIVTMAWRRPRFR